MCLNLSINSNNYNKITEMNPAFPNCYLVLI